MGISLRIFLVKDNDFLQRLPLAQYDRLLQRDPNESLPQFAGKQVRYALVVLDLVNRRPVEILRIQYSLLSFDSGGRIDAAEGEKEAKLAFEVLPPLPIERPPGQAIDVQYHLPTTRYDDEYKWMPSPEIEAAIVKAIFGSETWQEIRYPLEIYRKIVWWQAVTVGKMFLLAFRAVCVSIFGKFR